MPRLTPAVARIAKAAMDAGLQPQTHVRSYRGVLDMSLDSKLGPTSAFGNITIGAGSGRVLRGHLCLGNTGRRIEFSNSWGALRVLRALPPAEDSERRHALEYVHDGDLSKLPERAEALLPRLLTEGLIVRHGYRYRLTPAGMVTLTRLTAQAALRLRDLPPVGKSPH